MLCNFKWLRHIRANERGEEGKQVRHHEDIDGIVDAGFEVVRITTYGGGHLLQSSGTRPSFIKGTTHRAEGRPVHDCLSSQSGL